MITYVDTSVLLKLLVHDEDDIEAARRLWLVSEFVVCSDLGYVEARAALAAAHRAGRFDEEGFTAAKKGLDGLWGQIDRVTVTSTLVSAAGEIAEQEGLRGYDAVHLTSAIKARATVLATADGKLLSAAARNGMDTL